MEWDFGFLKNLEVEVEVKVEVDQIQTQIKNLGDQNLEEEKVQKMRKMELQEADQKVMVVLLQKVKDKKLFKNNNQILYYK